jgi:hypothetical protein
MGLVVEEPRGQAFPSLMPGTKGGLEIEITDRIKQLGDNWQIYYKHPARLPHWPKISEIPREESSDMYAKLISTPPLGQATVLEKGQKEVKFDVCLEADSGSEKSWEVALWFNGLGEVWTEQAFAAVEKEDAIVSPFAPN